ncbi:MAG TPA: hypothetical protein VGK67_07355 [Myxococcales bacterium]|jgi:hypothetical protein
MMSRAGCAAALSLTLSFTSVAARAQAVGDTVRLETTKGVVEGTLVDRLPGGYLVNKGKASVVVPYASVTQVVRLAPAPLSPMTVPPAAPAPAKAPGKNAPKGSPAPAAQPPPAETFQGFAVDPAPVEPAPAGLEPPPPPPVPPVPPVPLPAAAPLISPVMVPIPALPPPPRPLPPVRYERRSKIVMGTGIAMVGLGVVAFLTGAGLAIDGESRAPTVCENYRNGQRCFENPNRQPRIDAGRVTMLVGAAVGVVGIPIWSIGAKRVPVKETAPSAQLSAGPGSAALTLRF